MNHAITSAFKKYASFKGRSTRSEYWYFILFYYLLGIIVEWITLSHTPAIGILLEVVFFIPMISLGTRRMHDVGKRGWWLLIPFVNLYFLVQPSGPMNEFDVVI